MNNDYNSSRNLPFGKEISGGLLSVRTTLSSCFGYNPRHTSIKLLLFFLTVFGVNHEGFSQAVILNPTSSAIAVCENGTPIILSGGPALSGNQEARWMVASSTGATIPAGILEEPSTEDVTATFNPNLSGVAPGNSITFVLRYTLDEDGDFDNNTVSADSSFATISITVNAAPTATATASSVDVCENGGSIFLTGSPSVGNGVGEWSGPTGITNTANSNNALFDPRGHDGIVPLIYTFSDGNNCPAKDTVHVLVHNAAIISPTPNLSVCANGDTIDLQGFPFKDTIESLIDTMMAINPSNSAFPTEGDGVWSGLGIVTPSTIEADSGRAKFVPMGLSGPITLTYTYTAGNGCTESITTRINVFEAPTVDGGTYGPFCESDDPIPLDGGTQVQGGVSMGTWGVLSTGNPAILTDISPSAGTAKFNPSIAFGGTDTLSYTFIDINGCEVIDTLAPIVVNANPVASVSNPGPGATTNDTLIMCLKDSIISLVGMPDPSGLGGTGKWTGAGVTDLDNNDNDASFNPELAGNGTHTIIYEYENSNGCSDTTAIFFVVNALPSVSTDKSSYTSCRDGNMSTGIVLTGLPTGSTGVWTGKGVVDNGDGTATFEPDSSSVNGLNMVTVQYKYSDAHGCTDSTTAIVTINTPMVNPIADQILCANENLSIAFTGTGSFEYKLTGDAIGLSSGTGTTLAGQVTNTSTDTLTAIVEVIPSINGCEGVRDTFEIKVKPLPTVDARLDTTVCAGSMTNPILFTGADLSPEATTYSWTNDNVNIGLAGSGTVDISTFMATNTSTSMITANIAVTPTAGGCSGTIQSFKINVNPLPTITVPNDTSYCEGETTSEITLSGSAGATLSWTLSGDDVGLLANNMATVPSFLADNTSGMPDTAKVVIIATLDGCEIKATDTLFIEVNPVTEIPSLTMALDTLCSTGAVITLNNSTTGSTTPSTSTPLDQLGIWESTSSGLSGIDRPAGTGLFDPTGLSGDIILSYTFINEYNCEDKEELTVTVENANPNPGTYIAVCSEGPKVQLAGVNTLLSTQSGYWTVKDSLGVVVNRVTATSADSLIGKAQFNQSGLRGTYTLIYTIKNLQNGCESKDSTTIDIGSTVVDLGIHTPVCSNDSLQQLVATPMSGSTITSGTWGIADTFNNAIAINPITKLTEFTADINLENLDGYYKLFYQYTNAAGCTDIDTLSSFFIVNKAPVITAPLDKEVCQDGATFDLVGSRSPTDPGELARWGPESIIIDPDVMDSAITFNPALFTDDVTLTYTFVDGNGCVGVDSVAIKINPLPTVTAGTNLTLDNGVFKVCESNSVLAIEATPAPVSGDGTAGMWTATTPLIDTNNNDEKVSFDLNGKSGPYNLVYTYTDAKTCMNSSTVTIDVIPKPVVFAGSDQDICESAGAITLTASLPNGISTGTGVWSGSTGLDASDNTSDNQVSFNPAGLANTTPIRIKYTYTDDVGCTAIDSLEITVKAPPTVDAGTYAAQCQNNAALTLQGTPNPNSSSNVGSSTWTVNGSLITSNSGAGTATLNLTNLTGPITAVYAYTDGDNCIGTDTAIIQIQAVTASSSDANGQVCVNDGMVTLTGSPIPTTGEKGTWTGTGVFDLSDGDAVAVFDPTNPAVTAGSVTLTYTFTDAAGCSNSKDTVILINDLPLITLGTGFDPICVTNMPVEISAGPVPSGTATAVWSGSGITNTTGGKAMFNPAGLSDTVKLTFTYTDANSCTSSKDTFIIVNSLPTLDLGGPYGPICRNADELRLAANTPHDNGQIGIWSGMGAKDTINTDSIAYFDPTGLTDTIKLTYTYTDSNSCTSIATENIVINTLPTVDAGTDQSVCVDNGPINLLGSPSPMGGEMGSWTTTSTGLNDITSIDAVAIFDPSIAGIGAHELTYTFTNGAGCVDSMKRTITVTGLPTVDLTSAGITQGAIICEESSLIHITGSPVPTIAGESGTWSGPGITDNNAQDAVATFNPSGLNGAIALIYTFLDDTGCSNSDTIRATVRDYTLDIGTYPAICESSDSIILTANISPNTFGGMGVWSGLGVLDSSATDSLAKFSPMGQQNTVDLTYTITDGEGCIATTTTSITIESPIAIAGVDSTVCINADLVNLLGSPTPNSGETGAWSTLSTGLTDNSNQDANATFDPATANLGVHTLSYKFTDAGGCIDSAMLVITVIDTPTVTLANVGIMNGDTICEESTPISLTGSPIPGSTGEGTWSGLGITNKNISAGTADFDPSGLSGAITLVYEFSDNIGCSNSDSITVFVQDYTLLVGSYGPVCASGDSIILTANISPNTFGGMGVWSGMGIVDSSMTDSLAKFSPMGQQNTVVLTYTITDGEGCIATAATSIAIETPIADAGTDSTVCIDANMVNLLGNPIPGLGETGEWSILPSGLGLTDNSNQDANATFNPATANLGTHTLSYKFTDTGGCIDSAMMVITVIDTPTVTLTNVGVTAGQIICEENVDIPLIGSPVPAATGEMGMWSGLGITNPNTTNGTANFDPSGLSGNITLVYEFLDDTGCSNSDSISVFVQDYIIDVGTYAPTCASGDSIILTANISPNTFGGMGVWSGMGIVDSSMTDSLAKFGPENLTGNIDLTYSITDGNGCVAIGMTTIAVESPVIVTGAYGPICENENAIVLLGSPVPTANDTAYWSGPGIIDASNQDAKATFNPNGLAGNTDIYAVYTFKDGNGCINKDSTKIIVTTIPIVDATTSNPTNVCATSDSITINATPIPSATNESGTWSGPGITDGNTGDAMARFSPNGLSGMVELIYTFKDDTGCMAADTLEIAVENLMANAGTDQTICESNGLLELGGNPNPVGDSTGTWSGPGVTDNSNMDSIGMFDPKGLSGPITLYYEVADAGTGCQSIDSVIITITSNIVTASVSSDTICKEAMPITLTGSPIPGVGEIGSWIQDSLWLTDGSNGDAVAIFDPSMVTGPYPRSVYALYEYTDANGCSNIDSTEIVVYELPVVNAGADLAICGEDNSFTVIGTPAPTASGSKGTWSGTGITDNGNGTASFNPIGLPTGMTMIFYTYEDRLGCSAVDTAMITIGNTVLDIGTYTAVCVNETSIPLSVITTMVSGDSSVWSGVGVVDSANLGKGSFNPSIAGYGTHDLIFTYKNNAGCISADTTTITVTQPTIGSFAPICTDNGLVTLTGNPLPSTGQTGVWTIDGTEHTSDTDGVFELDPSSYSGTVSLKYKISGNGCADSVSTSIIINPLPTVNAGLDIDTCESSNPLIITGSAIPTGGSSKWTGTGITDANSNDAFAVFDPAGLSGPITVTYEVTDANGCTAEDTRTIMVTNLSVTAGTYGALCESASPITLTGTPIGGTWAGLGVGATDLGTGTAIFDPSGRNGDVTISYTYTSGTCTEIASTTITVFDAEVNPGTYGPLCQNDAPLTITGFPIPSGGAIGTWSGTGLTNINPSAGTATLNPAAVTGNTSLTYTFITNGCSKTATTNVLVNQSATASITIDQAQICEGGSVQLTATTTNAAGITWATNGIGSFSPTTGNTTTYTPSGTVTGSDRVDEISVIAVASTGNCPVAVASTNLRIVKPATVDLGQDISFCDVTSGTLTPVTLGTGNTVSWSSTNGAFNSSTATSPIYTGNALTTSNRTDVITITVNDAFNACPVVTDVMNITLTTPIKITEGSTGAICEGDTIGLVANYTGGTSGFTSQVNGNKGNVIIHGGQIKYVANANDGLTIRKDTVIIINPDLDGAGPCVTFRDTMIVDVSPMATVNLVADTTICSGEEINLVAAVTGDFAAFSSSLNLSTTVTNYAPTGISTAVTDKVIYSTQLPGSLCPAAIDSVEVTINRLSTTALSVADATICEVNTVALAAGVTGGLYNWEVLGNAGTLNDNTLENPTYTPNNTSFSGTRMDTLVLNLVSATDRCNTGLDTAIINVLEVGSFTPLPDTLVCSNNTIALAVPIIGAYDQFTWSSPNGTFSTTTDSNTVYTPTAITTGSRLDTVVTNILFTGGACPAVPDTAIITVLAGVEVTAGVDVTVCNGIGVGLNGTLGGGATTGTWQVVGGFGTFDNTASMNAVYTPNPTGTTARIDVLVLTSNDPDGSGGCVAATDTVLVTVTPSPTVSLGQDLTTFAGQPVTLTATVSEAVISSQWSSTPGSLSNSGLDQTTFTPLSLGTASSRVDQIVYEGFFTNQNCGSAKDTILVTVNAPQAINKAEKVDFCSSLCLDELTTSIDGNTGVAIVLANNINPLDSCGVNAQFGFKFWDPTMSMAEPNTVIDIPNLPNSISFNCNDRGPQAVNVYVSDAEMNTQLCPVVINVMDNSVFCGERTIAGKITNAAGEPVVGFDVFVEEISEVGGISPSVKTDENGAYSIIVEADKEYRIIPRRNIDVAEGVTAFDNVIISRHILGLQPFSSPYQTIAADVNKSGTVTAFDIVIIRKIVLARDGMFDNNTSWRFVDANYQFSSIMDAASAPFQESFTVTKTTGNVLDMDFIAVKIGDINGANPENAGLIANATSRNDATAITFETTNLAVKKGKTYEVPFRLLNPETVASYQFTLDFKGLALQTIKEGVAAPEHFGTTMNERGLLTTCWSAANPVNTEKEWFTLQFTANKDGRLSELLSINSAITPIEAYTTDEANIGIELSFVQPVSTTFDLFQNKPNPFKNETVIGFALPIASKAKITVLDMQGRTIHSVEGVYSNGYNEVVIDMTNLPRGVFYYRLETVFGTKVQKMMHIE